MNNDWKFWINSHNHPQNACPDIFNYYAKFCGNPVYSTSGTGNNVTYPAPIEIHDNLIKVPIARDRGFRFTVFAVTNCNNCICNQCPPATPYYSASSWQFNNYKSYEASDVEIVLNNAANSNIYPVFAIPLFIPVTIFFNCAANPTSADICP